MTVSGAARAMAAPAGGAARVLHAALAAADVVTRWMAYTSGVTFLLTAFYITLDALGRRFIGISSAVTDEFGGYALALGGMWALAHALRTGGHVRIDVLLPHLPRALRITLNYGAMATMALFAAMMTIYSWRLALESLQTGARAMSFVQTPLWLPQVLMCVGLSVLTLEAALLLLTGIADSIARRRLADLEVLGGESEGAGVPSL